MTARGGNGPLPGKTFTASGGSLVLTETRYDANGNVRKLIDDRGGTTTYTYDTLDRQVEMQFHDGAKRTNSYNEAVDIVQYTDENGSVFANTYDAIGRRTACDITPAAGVAGTDAQSFEYDGLSRQTKAVDSVGTDDAVVEQFYDSLSRVIEDAQTYDGNSRYVTHHAFESLPMTGLTYPDGRQVVNEHDPLYRRIEVRDAGGPSIAKWQFYGPARVAEVELGNGLICSHLNNTRTRSAIQEGEPTPGWGDDGSDRLGYDGAGRMIAKRFLTGGIDGSGAYDDPEAVVGFTTAFDRSSNKLYERHLHAESRSHLYEPFAGDPPEPQGGYDSLDRLRQYQRGTLATGGGSITSPISLPNTNEQRDYVLDGLGNWKQTVHTPVGGSETTETRNHNKLNQITKRQPDDGDPWIDFTHDDNGNLLDDGVRLYTWDALNRLVVVMRKSDDKTIAEYAYDARNFRIRKTVSNGGLSGNIPNGTTDFVYNSDWQCLEERDNSDDIIRQYVWGRYIDELLQQRNHGTEPTMDHYPLQDLLYRAAMLVGESGAAIETYDTDVYGNTIILDAPGSGGDWWGDDAQQTQLGTAAFIFTGRRRDPESDLYRYRRRLFGPTLGRFMQRDPLGYVDGLSLYASSLNNPAAQLDPSGTQTVPVWHKNCAKIPSKEKRCDCHCIYAYDPSKCRQICLACWGGKDNEVTIDICMCTCLAAGTTKRNCEKACNQDKC